MQVHPADEEGGPGEGVRQRPDDGESVQEPPDQRGDHRGGRGEDLVSLLRDGAAGGEAVLFVRALQDSELREEAQQRGQTPGSAGLLAGS